MIVLVGFLFAVLFVRSLVVWVSCCLVVLVGCGFVA